MREPTPEQPEEGLEPSLDLEAAVSALVKADEETAAAGLAGCLSPTEIAVLARSAHLGDEVTQALRPRALRHVGRCGSCRSRLRERLRDQQRLVIHCRDLASNRQEQMLADERSLQTLLARNVILGSRRAADATASAALGQQVMRGEKPMELVATVVSAPARPSAQPPTPQPQVRLRALEGPVVRDRGLFFLEARLAPHDPDAQRYRRDTGAGRIFTLSVAIRRDPIEVRLPAEELDEEGRVVVTADLRDLKVDDGRLRPQDLVLEIAAREDQRD